MNRELPIVSAAAAIQLIRSIGTVTTTVTGPLVSLLSNNSSNAEARNE